MSHAEAIISGGRMVANEEKFLKQFTKRVDLIPTDYIASKTDVYKSLSQTAEFIEIGDPPVAIAKSFHEIIGELNQINKQNNSDISALKAKRETTSGASEQYRLDTEISEKIGKVLFSSFGINMGKIAEWHRNEKSFPDLPGYKAFSEAEAKLVELAPDLKKYYDLNCYSVSHFLNIEKAAEMSHLKKLISEKANEVGNDSIFLCFPYELSKDKEGNIKHIYKSQVRFNDGEAKGNEIKPQEAFYSLMVAKGVITMDQLMEGKDISFENMGRTIENEVNLLHSRGIKQVYSPAVHAIENGLTKS